jgi:S1-C subfamily serine protease
MALTCVLTAGACTGDDAARPAQDDGGATTGTSAQAGGVYDQIPDVVEAVAPSVVAVLTDIGEGSGVVYRSDGVIVTNQHVVVASEELTVAFDDGDREPAELVASDDLTDLAVLRVDRSGLPIAEFDPDLPSVGALAIAIGNPLGFENTVTAGIVSGLHRSIPGSTEQSLALVDLIQTDAAISPGNSGGALVDAEGEVVGINVAYIPPQASAVALGFAIPADTVVRVVDALLDDGEVDHVFFGVQPAQVTPRLAQEFGVERDEGVLVLEVIAGSAAERAGVAAGDVIVALGSEPIRTVEGFLGELRRRAPGDTVTVVVVRNGEERRLDVRLTSRP